MVVSASLGGPRQDVTNQAVAQLVEAGVTVVVAAGNDDHDAMYSSPASEESAFTIGAVDKDGNAAGFSNYGSLVDLWAPGVDIISAKVGGGYVSLSGTSMATPHVSGVVALIMQARPDWTPAEVRKELVEHCSDDGGVLKNLPGQILRTNTLLYTSSCILAEAPSSLNVRWYFIVAGCFLLVLAIPIVWVCRARKAKAAETRAAKLELELRSGSMTAPPRAPMNPTPPRPTAKGQAFVKAQTFRPAASIRNWTAGAVPAPEALAATAKVRAWSPETVSKLPWRPPFAGEITGPEVDKFVKSYPKFASDVFACYALLQDESRFQNRSEAVFASVRISLHECSREPHIFGAVPGKVHVWDFILRFAAIRRVARAQVVELAAMLDTSRPWKDELSRYPDLRRIRQDVLGP